MIICRYLSRFRYKDAVESFLEELVVRRELSDNFCHCECLKQYDCKMPREVICIPSIHSEPHTHIYPSHLHTLQTLPMRTTAWIALRCGPGSRSSCTGWTRGSTCTPGECCCSSTVRFHSCVNNLRRCVTHPRQSPVPSASKNFTGSNSRRPRHTMSCGMRRSCRWSTSARCTASCACTGPRRSWSGRRGRQRQYRCELCILWNGRGNTGVGAVQVYSEGGIGMDGGGGGGGDTYAEN